MTNGDKIRSMTDEELSDFVDNASKDFCQNCSFQINNIKCNYNCKLGFLEWCKYNYKQGYYEF